MKLDLNYLFLYLWCIFLKNTDPTVLDVGNDRLEGFTTSESVFYRFVDSPKLVEMLKETVETSKYIKKLQLRKLTSQ